MSRTDKPQIPSLKDTQKNQIKINGLQGGLSLIERLKQFKKKDLAFVTAGLGVLFMAPVAEHFMMSPESSTGTMTPGWDMKKGSAFGDGSSPYENGVNGLAPGGVTGGGDVITPLNVRDPSSLILGPGASQQPAATSTTPPAPKDNSDWKDAIANAGSSAAKKAVEKASLPVPKPSLTNAGLRGLGAVSGGGGGTYTPPPINSNLAPNKAAASNSLQRVQAPPGFRGVGARGSENASGGAMENLKKAAAGAVDSMNRRGSAASAAEQAASASMGGGSSGGGAGAGGPDGSADKAASGSQNKDSSNVGESLEFMRRKAEQDKAIDLQWKLKEKSQMLWPNLQEKLLEKAAMGPLEAAMARLTLQMKTWGSNVGGGNAVYKCKGLGMPISASKVGNCDNASDPDYVKGLSYLYEESTNSLYAASANGCSGIPKGTECVKEGGGADSGKDKKKDPEKLPPGPVVGTGPGARSNMTLAQICDDLSSLRNAEIQPGMGTPQTDILIEKMKKMIAQVSEAGVNLEGQGAQNQFVCGAKPFDKIGGRNVRGILNEMRKSMGISLESLDAAQALRKGAVAAVDDEAESVTKSIDASLGDYIDALGGNNQAAADAAWKSASGAAKKYTEIYNKADGILKGSKDEAGIDVKYSEGVDPLPLVQGGLVEVDPKTGYLAQAKERLESAKSGQAAAAGSVDSDANLRWELQEEGIKTAKDWIADIGDAADKVRQESFERLKTDAEQIGAAYKAAESATDPKQGSIPVSIARAKTLVGLVGEVKDWANSSISETPAGGAAAATEIRTALNEKPLKAVSDAKEQVKNTAPETAVANIRLALEGKKP